MSGRPNLVNITVGCGEMEFIDAFDGTGRPVRYQVTARPPSFGTASPEPVPEPDPAVGDGMVPTFDSGLFDGGLVANINFVRTVMADTDADCSIDLALDPAVLPGLRTGSWASATVWSGDRPAGSAALPAELRDRTGVLFFLDLDLDLDLDEQ